MLKKNPLIMSLNLDRKLFVTKLVPIDKAVNNWKELWPYEEQNPLPFHHDRALSFAPFGVIITTNEVVQAISGWQVVESDEWKDSRKRNRSNLVKNAISQHIKRRKNIMKIGNQWSYHREEVNDNDSLDSVIHHCLSAWYVEVGDIDGIACDFVRKVRSASSVQDELNQGVFPYGEGSDFSDIMVNVDAGDQEFRSGLLGRIDESENLNMKFKGSLDSIRQYDEKNGFSYTDDEAANTCIVYVKHGKKEFPYAASRVFRVLRIEDWEGNLKDSMKDLLRLKPTQFSKHLRKGMRLLWGLQFGGASVNFELPKDVDWEVKVADVGSYCSLVNSPSSTKLLFNGEWKHHIGKYPIEPYPDVSVSYCVHEDDLWALDQLKSFNESVFSIVPQWRSSPSGQTIVIKGNTETEITQSIQRGIKDLEEIQGQQLVVSGLRPSRPNYDAYTWLKRRLTEVDIKHQNYQIFSSNRFKAPNQKSTHEMNICQLLMKFGRLPVPYKIDLGQIDLVVGVDIGRMGRHRSRPAMAVSIDKFGNMYGGSVSSEPQPGEEMSNRTLRDLINNQVNRYEQLTEKNPNRVLFIRDGNSSSQELEDMQTICDEWLKIGVDVAWITLQKTGSPRLLLFEDGEVVDKLPESQCYLVAGGNSAWCWTTGGSVGRFPGIPRGFSFRLERNFSSQPLTIDDWCRVLIAQAKTSQVNPYANTRLPFTLHLADKMAKALIRGSIPPDYSGDGFPAC